VDKGSLYSDEFFKFIHSIKGQFKMRYVFKKFYEFIGCVIDVWNDKIIFFYFIL